MAAAWEIAPSSSTEMKARMRPSMAAMRSRQARANSTEEISPDQIDLLVVIHPKQLPAKTLFAIDQWVAQGGDTIVFLDAYALDDRAPENPQQRWMQLQYQPASDLEPLLSHWGVERLAPPLAPYALLK